MIYYLNHMYVTCNTSTMTAQQKQIMTDHPIQYQNNMAWRKKAQCLGIDPDLFFPDRGVSSAQAKQICEICEVAKECLDYALGNKERYGIWGGLNEKDRRVHLRERKKQSKAKKETLSV